MGVGQPSVADGAQWSPTWSTGSSHGIIPHLEGCLLFTGMEVGLSSADALALFGEPHNTPRSTDMVGLLRQWLQRLW